MSMFAHSMAVAPPERRLRVSILEGSMPVRLKICAAARRRACVMRAESIVCMFVGDVEYVYKGVFAGALFL